MDIVGRLAGVVALIAAYTAVALLVMRHYARETPLLRLAGIALGAFTTMALVLIVIYGGAMRNGGPSSSAPALLILPALAIPGAIISHYLKRLGIAKPFPGIGARAMFAILGMQIVLMMAYLAISGWL